MIRPKNPLYFLFFFLLLVSACSSPTGEEMSQKLSENDPFAATMPASEFFELDSQRDHIVDGKNGTTVVIPQGAFLRANGSAVNGDVVLELMEAPSWADKIKANLTSTSNGEPLESGGMIYLNAYADGECLIVNPDNPIYVEIPTNEVKSGMMVYEGERDAEGNMNWVNPKPMRTYLQTVPFEVLDFLPEGFREAVRKNMPYKSYETSNQLLEDSLYYNLTPYVDPNAQREADDFYVVTQELDWSKDLGWFVEYVIPTEVAALKSDGLKNSFLATRAFEKRMQSIHASCQNDLLSIYVQNLDNPLFYSDSMAYAFLASYILGETKVKREFADFVKEGLTNTKEGTEIGRLLSKRYQENFKAIDEELKQRANDLKKRDSLERKEYQDLVKDFGRVRKERNMKMFNKYGMTFDGRLGWVNVDKLYPEEVVSGSNRLANSNRQDFTPSTGDVSSTRSIEIPVSLEISASVEKTGSVYCYLIFPTLNHISDVKQRGDGKFIAKNFRRSFQFFNIEDDPCYAVVIDCSEEPIRYGIESFSSIEEMSLKVNLKNSSWEVFEDEMSQFSFANGIYDVKADIEQDIESQNVLEPIKKELDKRNAEISFERRLIPFAFPCGPSEGERLFRAVCASCHRIDSEVLAGPGLCGATRKYTREEFKTWIQNPDNALATMPEKFEPMYEFWAEAGMAKMPGQALSYADCNAVYDFIEQISNNCTVNE